MKFKNERGLVNIDYVTAVIVFMVGSIAVLGLYLSVYKAMAKIKVDETIIGYITEICENIDLVNYEDVDTQAEVNSIIANVNIPEQYSVACESIEKYDSSSTDLKDLVQKINLKISYTFDNLKREFIVSKIKVKE